MSVIILLMFIFADSDKSLFAQTTPNKPEVGKPCPDFVLEEVTHYSKSKVTLKDFKGQWLILDFWFTGCTSCISSFPKINQLQREFKDQIKFVLVGKNDKKFNGDIEQLFEKLRLKQQLNLISAYDSLLHGNWEITKMPHMIVIDPEGIVRHITGGRDMTNEKLKDMIAGKPVTFYPKNRISIDFNPWENSTGGQILYRSVLTRWNGEKQESGYPLNDFVNFNLNRLKKGWTVSMVPLYALYNYAYFGRWTWTWRDPEYYGKYYHRPLLQMKDTTKFAFDYRTMSSAEANLFNYSLFLPYPEITEEILMEEIRKNLASVFGYKVEVKSMPMPVYYLMAQPSAKSKLVTKGGEPDNGVGDDQKGYRSFATGFTLKNQPMDRLLRLITWYLADKTIDPFIDKTGITGNIDITIDADLTDWENINNALKRNGLELVRDKLEMNVILISDI
jgi:thiol-disulfide isomerase/thioredoxin